MLLILWRLISTASATTVEYLPLSNQSANDAIFYSEFIGSALNCLHWKQLGKTAPPHIAYLG